MLSLRYIRIRKERPAEQNLASIWCDACAEFGIPCIIIYFNDENTAYISASLKHLQRLKLEEDKLGETEQKLQSIQLQYAGNAKGYWKHNSYYHTFDGIPVTNAREAAAVVFDSLSEAIYQNNRTLTQNNSLNS